MRPPQGDTHADRSTDRNRSQLRVVGRRGRREKGTDPFGRSVGKRPVERPGIGYLIATRLRGRRARSGLRQPRELCALRPGCFILRRPPSESIIELIAEQSKAGSYSRSSSTGLHLAQLAQLGRLSRMACGEGQPSAPIADVVPPLASILELHASEPERAVSCALEHRAFDIGR